MVARYVNTCSFSGLADLPSGQGSGQGSIEGRHRKTRDCKAFTKTRKNQRQQAWLSLYVWWSKRYDSILYIILYHMMWSFNFHPYLGRWNLLWQNKIERVAQALTRDILDAVRTFFCEAQQGGIWVHVNQNAHTIYVWCNMFLLICIYNYI